MHTNLRLTLHDGLTVFLSAFLLFQVQPLIGKMILSWFGGSGPRADRCASSSSAHWRARGARATASTARPLVVELARREFSFLSRSKAAQETAIDDARLIYSSVFAALK